MRITAFFYFNKNKSRFFISKLMFATNFFFFFFASSRPMSQQRLWDSLTAPPALIAPRFLPSIKRSFKALQTGVELRRARLCVVARFNQVTVILCIIHSAVTVLWLGVLIPLTTSGLSVSLFQHNEWDACSQWTQDVVKRNVLVCARVCARASACLRGLCVCFFVSYHTDAHCVHWFQWLSYVFFLFQWLWRIHRFLFEVRKKRGRHSQNVGGLSTSPHAKLTGFDTVREN